MMRRHVDRELSRARIAAAGWNAGADPAAVTGRVFAVLRRTPEGGRIDWRNAIPGGLPVSIDAGDLTEAMGAVLENAAQHARARVDVEAATDGAMVEIRVSDDGDGVDESRLAELTIRGTRLDAKGQGAGLGLAIASEICEAAGGSLMLRNTSPGLEVTLRLRAAQLPPVS